MRKRLAEARDVQHRHVTPGRARVPAGRWDMCTDSSNHLPARRRPAHLPLFDAGNRASIVFLTVCTRDRQAALANPAMHDSLVRAWAQASHWLVGRYVIMPDHVHLFCAPGIIPPQALGSWVPGPGASPNIPGRVPRFPALSPYGTDSSTVNQGSSENK